MVIKPREVKLKNNQMLLVETASPQYAREILSHRRQTALETQFLIRSPEEVLVTEEAVEKEIFYLKKLQADPGCLMLSGWLDGKMVGMASMLPVGCRKKVAHRGGLSITVLREAWRLGIGRAMMDLMTEHAGAAGYTQLELSVLEDNHAAYALYRKLGFKVYGTLPGALRSGDGTDRTMIFMYKNL